MPFDGVGFLEYIIKEGINPIEIPFGMDTRNGKVESFHSEVISGLLYRTYFEFDNKKYMILISGDGNVKYNLAPKDESIEEISEFLEFKRVPTQKPLAFFSILIPIVLRSVQKIGIDSFFFQGHDAKLRRLYSRFIDKPLLIQYAKARGFEFDSIDSGKVITFRKR